MELALSVKKATADCIEEGILRDILLKNRAEVENMVLGTWGTELHLKKVKEEQEQMEKQREEMEKQREEMEKLKRQKDAANLLTQKLLEEGKADELRRASTDEEYQLKLLKEYELL